MHRAVAFRPAVALIALALALCAGAGCKSKSKRQGPAPVDPLASMEPDDPRLALPWAERRAAHPTQLRQRGPVPIPWVASAPPEGVEELRYPSGELQLLAWLAVPEGASADTPAPALVYFHGAFSLAADDFEHVRPFLDAGFVVLTPTYRGENGNPGDFELLYGEADDAAAAVRWLADRPEVDPERIYTLGHSAGGAISALMSLVPDLPVAATASIGGIYVPETFGRWRNMKGQRELVRFDPDQPLETHNRVLGPNACDMQRPHLAIYGVEDRWFIDNVAEVQQRADACSAPFSSLEVPGDHMSSVGPGVAAWLQRSTAGTTGG